MAKKNCPRPIKNPLIRLALKFCPCLCGLPESESFFKRSHKVIVALTVQEILDEQIAKKRV